MYALELEMQLNGWAICEALGSRILTLKDKKKEKKEGKKPNQTKNKTKKSHVLKSLPIRQCGEPCKLQTLQNWAPHYLTMRHLTGNKKLSTEHSLFKVQNTKPLPFKNKMHCFYCINTWGFSQMQIINLQAQWFRYTSLLYQRIYITICFYKIFYIKKKAFPNTL